MCVLGILLHVLIILHCPLRLPLLLVLILSLLLTLLLLLVFIFLILRLILFLRILLGWSLVFFYGRAASVSVLFRATYLGKYYWDPVRVIIVSLVCPDA